MKLVAAYLLAVLGGNKTPSADDIKTILASVGVEAEDERIELLLSQVKGKDLAELIACGREKMASLPTGGGGGGIAAAVDALAPIVAAASVAAEAKKEEKEDVEDSDEDICLSLFDDM